MGLPWLARCFGIGFDDTTPLAPVFKETPAPVAKPAPKPKPRPATSWRDMPILQSYMLKKKVGKGGFSEVYLGEHKESKELYAVKVVQLACADLDADEIANLIAEAKYLQSLDCPYLLKCREYATNGDWLVLVLEYMTGGEMFDHIFQVKKYTEAMAAKLFAQVVSAVSYLHNLNIIHRDIKPENILFTEPVEESEAAGKPLRIKIIDLGMAAHFSAETPITGCVGTPGFVSPEVWHDKPHTFAMDVYALGVVLFIMLTGRKPHSGYDIRMMTYCDIPILNSPAMSDERFLSLSQPARELCLAMMADSPKDRPTCLEVLRHPFIAAVDSNGDAHREMGDVVRRRMRELTQLRRLHGLRYAMHAHRPEGTDDKAFLEVLDRRRLRLKNAAACQSQENSSRVLGPNGTPCASARPSVDGNCSATANGNGNGSGAALPSVDGSCTPLARNSLNLAYRASDAMAAAGGSTGGRMSRDASRDLDAALSHHLLEGSNHSRGGATVDKMALLSALPDMARSTTMPARRYREGPEGLSPVPSCDPSMYTGMDDAAMPGAWSAYPLGYEALQHRDALMEGLAPGAAHAAEGAEAGMGRVREPPAPLSTALEDPKEGTDKAASG
ncbi:hypothetical protein HYH03_005819 [Edaphochlamys debaryana]|uniref:Protein kinase domain-containing protein n=1 Tax=Edaphochlamys debaryana TaxID=47281 RepID=A0A835Y8L8_9CHLO|nr:hypothetical protein HYH03_005819 [Edaphochlamys debaryana]|eukprot:KAG2496221.1 hypothetical protein HYH03_005819 [Edaphochlamys debaryana]